MEYKHIDQLLEKYWAAESSLEEENRLHAYFQSGKIAPQHQMFAPLFQLFSVAERAEISEDFDQKLLAQLQKEATAKSIPLPARSRSLFFYLSRTAAAIALLFALWFAFQKPTAIEIAQLSQQEKEEAKLVYQQTKAALLLLSQKMNKGTDTAVKGIHQVEKSTKIFK